MNFLGTAKPQQPSAEYYPLNLGNLAPGSVKSYSFLVWGRDDRAIQVQVLTSLYRHGAKILSFIGYADEKTREFTLNVSCDLAAADVTPDDFVIELRRMKSVKNAVSTPLKNKIFDGFMFPLTLMYSNRVIAVNSTLPFWIQERLTSDEDKDALRDVGKKYALDIVRQVKERLGVNAPASIIQDNVRGYLKGSGWGSFVWESETSFERVTITDPPTSNGIAANNQFLHGMASGLVEAFKNRTFGLAEEVYNKDTRSLSLMLSEKKARTEAPRDKQKIPKDIELRALEEVEKVIKSVEFDEDGEAIVTTVSSSGQAETQVDQKRGIHSKQPGEKIVTKMSPPEIFTRPEEIRAAAPEQQHLHVETKSVEIKAVAAGPIIVQDSDNNEKEQEHEQDDEKLVESKSPGVSQSRSEKKIAAQVHLEPMVIKHVHETDAETPAVEPSPSSSSLPAPEGKEDQVEAPEEEAGNEKKEEEEPPETPKPSRRFKFDDEKDDEDEDGNNGLWFEEAVLE